MSIFSDVTVELILKELNLKIKELKSEENKDIVKGLEIAKKIVEDNY